MAQKRIDYYGRFTPTGVDTAQAERLQALAGVAESIGDIAFDIGAGIAKQRGAEAGAQAGIEAAQAGQAPETREGLLSSISLYDQAYNEAAVNAYGSGIRVDSRRKIQELEASFADDPDPVAFRSSVDGYVSGIMEGLPPEMAARLRAQIDNDVLSAEGRIADNLKERQFQASAVTINEELNQLADAQARAAREGNEAEVQRLGVEIENLATDNISILDPEKVATFNRTQDDRLVVQGVIGQLDRVILENPDTPLRDRIKNGEQFLRTLIESDQLEDLSPEQQSQVETAVAQRLNNLRTRLVQDDTEFNIELSDYQIQASSGALDINEVDEQANQWHREGRITLAQMTGLKASARSGLERRTEVAETRQAITRQFTDNADPYYRPTQTQANDYYDDVYAPSIQDASPQQRAVMDAIFIQKTRMIPSAVSRQVNANLLSGNPEQIMQAADIIDRVDEIPGMFDQLTNAQTKAFASNLVSLMDVMEPAEAVRLSNQLVDPADQARVSARRDKIKTEKYDDKYESWTDEVIDDTNPTSFQVAVSRYKTIFESYYLAGSTEEAAREQAEKFLRINYAESEFGGMMYPPEQYYAVNGSIEYVRDELDRAIRDENPSLSFDRDNIYLISDDYTARTATTGAPQYRVLLVDDDGVFQQRDGYFIPDVQAERDRITAENQALVEEIRAGGELAQSRARFEERRAAYEAREGKPTESVPASQLYQDTIITDAAGAIVTAAEEAYTGIPETMTDIAEGLIRGVKQKGQRQRSRLIEDVQRRQEADK